MAKLAAHPGEVARWEATTHYQDFDPVVRQYSLRRDGYVLSKVKLDGGRGWSVWRIYGRYIENLPAGEHHARRLTKVLERKHTTVEVLR